MRPQDFHGPVYGEVASDFNYPSGSLVILHTNSETGKALDLNAVRNLHAWLGRVLAYAETQGRSPKQEGFKRIID